MKIVRTKEENLSVIESIFKMEEDQVKEIIGDKIITTALNHVLSVKNIAITLEQHPEATVVGGWRQWKANGRKIKEGEDPIWITAPVFNSDKKTIKNWVGVRVYDITQTELI